MQFRTRSDAEAAAAQVRASALEPLAIAISDHLNNAAARGRIQPKSFGANPMLSEDDLAPLVKELTRAGWTAQLRHEENSMDEFFIITIS
jgi:hypothetical protein